jgi:hypothetical protein
VSPVLVTRQVPGYTVQFRCWTDGLWRHGSPSFEPSVPAERERGGAGSPSPSRFWAERDSVTLGPLLFRGVTSERCVGLAVRSCSARR